MTASIQVHALPRIYHRSYISVPGPIIYISPRTDHTPVQDRSLPVLGPIIYPSQDWSLPVLGTTVVDIPWIYRVFTIDTQYPGAIHSHHSVERDPYYTYTVYLLSKLFSMIPFRWWWHWYSNHQSRTFDVKRSAAGKSVSPPLAVHKNVFTHEWRRSYTGGTRESHNTPRVTSPSVPTSGAGQGIGSGPLPKRFLHSSPTGNLPMITIRLLSLTASTDYHTSLEALPDQS